jgi:hypothetical protein
MAETITQITQPPEFIEAESKLYLDQLQQAIGGLKGADLSKIMGPQFVAGLDPLQQQAQQADCWYRCLSALLTISCRISRTYCISAVYVSISTRCNWNNITRI